MKEAPSVMRRNNKPKFVQANLGFRNFKVVVRYSLIVLRFSYDSRLEVLTLSLPARAGFTPHLI